MEAKNEVGNNKVGDDVILPGFRFHPTDEELVGFYLRRKILQQSLPIELIKHVDIYKYDPWDLPKLASTGEKEWYFYCPRDRKYRNSARPNRVTCAGFWKATGTDRPIYSSDAAKCIGLKKSLVFYRGRAAKGIKTDWMMHEFRLPSMISDSAPPNKLFDKSLPPNDSWAICRIFKKTNSMAQRALSHSWISPPLPENNPISDINNQPPNPIPNNNNNTRYYPETISTHIFSKLSSGPTSSLKDLPTNLMFPTIDMIGIPINHSPANFTNDAVKVTETVTFGAEFNGFTVNLTQDDQAEEAQFYLKNIQNQQWNNNIRSVGFPFSSASSISNSGNLSWNS